MVPRWLNELHRMPLTLGDPIWSKVEESVDVEEISEEDEEA